MSFTIEADLVLGQTLIKHISIGHVAVINWAITDNSVGGSAQTWAEAFQVTIPLAIKSRLDTEAVFLQTRCIKGDGTDTYQVGESTGPTVAGTRSSLSQPPNCAVLVKKLTGLGGRRQRGRLFIPWFVTAADVGEDGNIDPAVVTTIQSAIDDLQDVLSDTGGTWTHVIENRFYDKPWTDPTRELTHIGSSAPVLGMRVEGQIATQRRRMARS